MSALRALRFDAPEYQADGRFRWQSFQYAGDERQGWELSRNGRPFLLLGPGYIAVESLCCGICATDMARRHLPFALPQVTGHEVAARTGETLVAIDINASHLSRRDHPHDCPYCRAGMPTHCPDRLTLGIDRLPGGLAPWVLAPVAGILAVPAQIPAPVATFIEPLAAALRAIETTPPRAGDHVAVLGPRRLGMLLIAALAEWRARQGPDFRLSAVCRNPVLTPLALRMGADQVVAAPPAIPTFDIVYDTSGTTSGLETALAIARRCVHIKSTHGRAWSGLKQLTAMVIDEIALAPARAAQIDAFQAQGLGSARVLVGPTVSAETLAEATAAWPGAQFRPLAAVDVASRPAGEAGRGHDAGLGFDLAIVGAPDEIDTVLRPYRDATRPLIRPRGTILVAAGDTDHPLLKAVVTNGLEIHTSRCGDLGRAIELLARDPKLPQLLWGHMLTHRYPLRDIETAFAMAGRHDHSIKVVVDTLSP